VSIHPGAARRAFSSYRGAPIGARAFVAARYVVAPLGTLAAELEGRTGRVLSLGSGLCMVERYLAELEPGLAFEGIDLDRTKVELLAATHARSPRVSLDHGDATDFHRPERYDIVLVCDAFHHFPPERHAIVAAAVAEALVPGGVALVKDLDTGPAWKYHWNRIHDRLVAGPEPITCRSPAAMAALLTEAGLVVERAERTEHRLTPYAHYLVRARKPA
jgi:2-polyprenyl-3-methyl-5-hydroxy-6-metoxy-1,4-benzoquinol methylase